MNRMLFFLITMLLAVLTSCKVGPKEGEYYEHKGTRDRIKIEYVGLGKDSFNFCKSLADPQNKIFKSTRGYDPIHIRYSEDDSIKSCIVFLQDGDVTKKFFMSYYNIINTDKLKEDYKIID